MVRTPSYDHNGIKKGAWSHEEDQLLRSYIFTYGHWNWRELPKFAGLKRCGKSCRLRWMNYLRPNLKHGNYTKEEEDIIMNLHQKHGNKWAVIATKLPGRTDNEIKNHWHTHLKKRVRLQSTLSAATSTNKSHMKALRSEDSEPEGKIQMMKSSNISHDIQILESCPLPSPETITSTLTSSTSSDEISTVGFGFEDDGGLLEEMVNNSSELFAELSSLSPLDYEIMNDDQVYTSNTTTSTSTTNVEYSVPETSRRMDTYEELQDDGFWSSFSDNNEVLLTSPFVNYSDDDLLDYFFRVQPSELGGEIV